MVPVGIGLLVNQFRVTDGVAEAVRGTVAGLVTMVPEGLVLLTSIAFAVGVVRLGRHQVLVQELPAIEGLARVDVVCLDKTGTLTEPVMQVSTLVEVPVRLGGAERGDRGDARRRGRRRAALGWRDRRRRAASQRQPAGDHAAVRRHPTTGPSMSSYRSPRRANGAARPSTGTARGCWAPPICWRAGHAASAEPAREMAGEGLRVLLLARAAGLGDGEGPPPRGAAGRAGRP